MKQLSSYTYVWESAEIELNLFCFPVRIVDDEKRLNATYIISVARKLGCSIFLLPEDIMEVRMKLYYVVCYFIT